MECFICKSEISKNDSNSAISLHYYGKIIYVHKKHNGVLEENTNQYNETSTDSQ